MWNFKGFNLVYSNQFFTEDLALSERSRADLSAGGPLSADFPHFRANSRQSRISRAKRMRPALSAKRNFRQFERHRDFHCESYAGPNFDLRPVLRTHLRKIIYQHVLDFFSDPWSRFSANFFFQQIWPT